MEEVEAGTHEEAVVQLAAVSAGTAPPLSVVDDGEGMYLNHTVFHDDVNPALEERAG